MKKILNIACIASTFCLLLTAACKEETFSYQGNQQTGKPHDPATPVVINGFTPDSGKIREKIVIAGSNFGNNKDAVKVVFNDGFSDKEATVISVDGTSIYCIVPRQADGRSTIRISIDRAAPITAPKTFRYTAAATVSWVAGAGTRNGTGRFYNDGSLADANFFQVHGIVALGDEQIMTFGFWESPATHVRLISVKEDKVITIQSGAYLGKPAINEDKTRVYATTLNVSHTVYEYRKESGWMPYIIGEIPSLGDGYDRIRSLVMMDIAHDPNQEWLYFCHKNRIFGRFNVNTGETEQISTDLNVPVRSWGGYMVYDKLNDCFYVSLYESYSIYKISRTGTNWGDGVQAELFAGSPSSSSVVDGYREDARFKQPMGMCMDEDGNIYVCDSDGADVIRKISALDGYVSIIAGVMGKESPQVNGEPAESVFLDPMDISYDGDGNFYICEFWESTIRKYAVE
jgi:hypothetical protein